MTNNIELIFGDCLEKMKDIPDCSVDMVLTDPPYGTTKCKWDTAIPLSLMWEEVNRIVKPQGALLFTAAQPFASFLIQSNLKNFKYELIWHKSKSGSAFTAKHRPISKHENILVFGKGKVTYNPQMEKGDPYVRQRKTGAINNHNLGLGKKQSITINTGERYPSSVLFFQQKWRRQDQVHPTQKPVSLMEYLILTYTNKSETVLDFTMGSGTTGVACVNTGRNFIGIELDEGYFKIAEKRIAEARAKADSGTNPRLSDAPEACSSDRELVRGCEG